MKLRSKIIAGISLIFCISAAAEMLAEHENKLCPYAKTLVLFGKEDDAIEHMCEKLNANTDEVIAYPFEDESGLYISVNNRIPVKTYGCPEGYEPDGLDRCSRDAVNKYGVPIKEYTDALITYNEYDKEKVTGYGCPMKFAPVNGTCICAINNGKITKVTYASYLVNEEDYRIYVREKK